MEDELKDKFITLNAFCLMLNKSSVHASCFLSPSCQPHDFDSSNVSMSAWNLPFSSLKSRRAVSVVTPLKLCCCYLDLAQRDAGVTVQLPALLYGRNLPKWLRKGSSHEKESYRAFCIDSMKEIRLVWENKYIFISFFSLHI